MRRLRVQLEKRPADRIDVCMSALGGNRKSRESQNTMFLLPPAIVDPELALSVAEGPRSLIRPPAEQARPVSRSSDRNSGVAFEFQRDKQLGWQLQIVGVNPGTMGVYKRSRVIAV